ncbi:MAG TPA: UPF0149 family protein [Halomonas sp.]|nr:UPF0149 family protein [Halomonas sp.]
MSLIDERQDFSTIADLFLLHGSIQSPAFSDGRLCARLAMHDIDPASWLAEVCEVLGVEQPHDEPSAERFLAWRRQTLEALSGSELGYEPLLPDELFSLAERARGLKEWTQGFLEVVQDAGEEPRETWSTALREALEDLEGVAAMPADLEESAENEGDLFALVEHVRMAAMLLYTEQHPGKPQVEDAESTTRH